MLPLEIGHLNFFPQSFLVILKTIQFFTRELMVSKQLSERDKE